MITKIYQSILTVALVTAMLFGGNATAQDAATAAPAVASTPAAAGGGDAAKGETLFKNNCAQCHSKTEEIVVGPGLAGIEKRRDFPWLVKWIHNSQSVVASGDPYATALYEKFNKTAMTAFPSFSEGDIHDILAFINKVPEIDAKKPPTDPQPPQGGGKFFNIVLIGLLLVMCLVLVALFGILRLLSKLSGNQATADGVQVPSVSLGQQASNSLKNIASNKTVRAAIIWLFILLGTKATLDGLYGIGVHKGYAPKQPIPFSHKLHAGDMKINCAYCHTGVYKGKQAGIPSANICMNCHNTIKKESPFIQQIYTAIEKNQPIEWVRVHNLPDLAYFNHSQHTNVGGLECKQCHGDIDKMEVVQQRSSLTMGWCIDCHRKTEVNTKGNAYYDKLMEAHKKVSNGKPFNVKDMGGLECSKCHY